MKKNTKPIVSVAIASLGRKSLNGAIKSLRENISKKSQIIICLPQINERNVLKKFFYQCEIIFSKEKGQVPQRIKAFKKAKNQFVLQIDDDVRLDGNCLNQLKNTLIKLGPKSAVSPVMCWEETKVPIAQFSKSIIRKTLEKIFKNKLRILPGKISRLGTNPAPNIIKNQTDLIETEWLPGGCVFHYKKNLILKNYYPFPGKAFSEDVMHSILLRQRGIRLFVDPNAKIYLKKDPPIRLIRDKIYNIYAESRARRHILKMLGWSSCLERIYTITLLLALPMRHWGSRKFKKSPK